jgi:hypothetical protein
MGMISLLDRDRFQQEGNRYGAKSAEVRHQNFVFIRKTQKSWRVLGELGALTVAFL